MTTTTDTYSTHRWVGGRMGGSPANEASYEQVCYCADCGCENLGDPAEFPELQYPPCDREDE